MSGPFKEKWSPKQREALIEAMFDRSPRMTQSVATRAANDGTLKDGLAPFPVPYNTVVDIRRKEAEKRRRLRANGTPLSQYATDVRILLARQLEDEQLKGLNADHRKLTALLQGIKQAQELEQEKDGKKPDEVSGLNASRLASRLAVVNGAAVGAGVGAGQSSASTSTNGSAALPSEASN